MMFHWNPSQERVKLAKTHSRHLPLVERLETREMMSGAGVGALATLHSTSHPAHVVHAKAGFQTSTIVAAIPNPTTGRVTLNATVTAVGTGSSPIGTVAFSIQQGNISLGSAPVSNSKATFNGSLPSSLKPGNYTIVASYGGAVNAFQPSSGSASLQLLASSGSGSGSGAQNIEVRRFGYHIQPTILVLNFAEPLNPASATNRSNYTILAAGPDGVFGTSDDRSIALKRVSYSAGPHAVSLTPVVRLPLNKTFRLIVNGSAPSGLTNTTGQFIDGDSNGSPGGNFVTTISRTSLAGTTIAAVAVV